MLSTSYRNGLSLNRWGSDMCLDRTPNSPSVEPPNVPSPADSFSHLGTGVQGCHDDLIDIVFPRGRLTSHDGREWTEAEEEGGVEVRFNDIVRLKVSCEGNRWRLVIC